MMFPAPLLGKDGATAVFGPQKGIPGDEVKTVDQAMKKYAQAVQLATQKDETTQKGAGAAGGLGFGILSFLNGSLQPGAKTIMQTLHVPDLIEQSDLVITGEGRFDDQSLMGKVPVAVAQLTKTKQKPVVAICGSQAPGLSAIYQTGIDLIIDTVNGPMTLETAIKEVEPLLKDAAKSAIRAYYLKSGF